MAKTPFDKPDPIDLKQTLEDVHAFVGSDLGEQYLTSLSAKYNEMHHKAELETMTAEQKAFYVERAAGIKFAIDWLVNRNGQYERGDLEDK